MQKMFFIVLAMSISACSQKDNGARITAQQPRAAAKIPKAISRSEPVFYNGKTYRVDLTPQAAGLFGVVVSGMSATQQKDAVAVATSSVRYFGCPDGKTGKLTDAPTFVDGSWKMAARCG
jgi:hypothetical protein